MGDTPKDLIHTIAEDMLARFAEAPLIDQYEAYQRLMSYWAETMQDDVFIIAMTAGRRRRTARGAQGDRRQGQGQMAGGGRPDREQGAPCGRCHPAPADRRPLLPRAAAGAGRRAGKAEELGREIEELVEEHGTEGGLLADALTEAGKLTAASVKARTKSGEADAEEAPLLRQAAKLMAAETAAKKAAKEAEEALTEATLKKYPELTEEEIRSLVVDDKWLTDIAELIEAEIEARTEQLTARVRVLTERYGHTLPEMSDERWSHSGVVVNPSAAMGFRHDEISNAPLATGSFHPSRMASLSALRTTMAINARLQFTRPAGIRELPGTADIGDHGCPS